MDERKETRRKTVYRGSNRHLTDFVVPRSEVATIKDRPFLYDVSGDVFDFHDRRKGKGRRKSDKK